MDKLSMTSADLTQRHIEAIAKLFPQVVAEGTDEAGLAVKGIDFELLKQELSPAVLDGEKERFRLTWPGKREAIVLANTPTRRTLRPVKADSREWDTTRNVYIEGDNLRVLKLLQESYLNKIKCIYIDPPYNTGKDFIYKDDFRQRAEEYLVESGQKDEEGNRLVPNNESNGRFHSDWLTMMYARLKLARNLLKDDGVIFISIDDNELDNLKKICGEIFGEKNYIGCITRATGTTTGQDANKLGSSLDYCLCYVKSSAFTLKGLPLSEKDRKRFSQDDGDGKGKYALLQLRKTGNADRREDRPRMYYAAKAPDGTDVFPVGPTGYDSRWRVEEKKYKLWEQQGLIVWKQVVRKELESEDEDDLFEDEDETAGAEDEGTEAAAEAAEHAAGAASGAGTDRAEADGAGTAWVPYVKYYLAGRTKKPSNLWVDIDGNKKGAIELRSLLKESKLFDNPKPTQFIQRLIAISTDPGDIVLDFFSGSGSTAQAVMQHNAETPGADLSFILVQLAEELDPDNKSHKVAYRYLTALNKPYTICELAKERIRRAADSLPADAEADRGFRVFRLDTSNMKDVYYTPGRLEQQDLFALESNIKEDRTPDDLLIQVMLEHGLELSLPLETRRIEGREVHFAAGVSLAACFEPDVPAEAFKAIAREQPARVVFRDSTFASDADRINVEETFKLLSPRTVIKVI